MSKPVEFADQQRKILKQLVTTKMPFGKYEGQLICDLPEYYLTWFQSKGYPAGTIGVLLATMYEIKLNGLERLIEGIKREVYDNK